MAVHLWLDADGTVSAISSSPRPDALAARLTYDQVQSAWTDRPTTLPARCVASGS